MGKSDLFSRRDFLKVSAAFASTTVAGSHWPSLQAVPFAIAGLGTFGMDLFREISLMGHHCVGIVEPSEQKRRKIQQCRYWPSVKDLLNREKPKVLVVATPDHQHAKDTIMALQHGVNVLLGSPVARTWSELEQIRAAAEQSKALVQTTSEARLLPELSELTEFLREGSIGAIEDISIRIRAALPEKSSWRSSLQFSNGETVALTESMLDHLVAGVGAGLGADRIFSAGVRTNSHNAVPTQQICRFRMGDIPVKVDLSRELQCSQTKAEIVYHGKTGTVFLDWFEGWTAILSRGSSTGALATFSRHERSRRVACLAWNDLVAAIANRRHPSAGLCHTMSAAETAVQMMVSLRSGLTLRGGLSKRKATIAALEAQCGVFV